MDDLCTVARMIHAPRSSGSSRQHYLFDTIRASGAVAVATPILLSPNVDRLSGLLSRAALSFDFLAVPVSARVLSVSRLPLTFGRHDRPSDCFSSTHPTEHCRSTLLETLDLESSRKSNTRCCCTPHSTPFENLHHTTARPSSPGLTLYMARITIA